MKTEKEIIFAQQTAGREKSLPRIDLFPVSYIIKHVMQNN